MSRILSKFNLLDSLKEEGNASGEGKFPRGHVFMGRGGGDTKEIANILISLIAVVFP